jgi:glutamyl-tRNA synthetase
MKGVLGIIQEKIKIGRDLLTWIEPFLSDDFSFEEGGLEKITPEAVQRLQALVSKFEVLDPFSTANTELALKSLAQELSIKVGDLVHPCRMAVSGRHIGPSLYHMLEVMGRERVLRRIRRTIELASKK